MADVFNAYVSPAIYGVINAILAVPALYGYAAVIFSAPVYGPIQGPLSKAVVLSSAVHQVVFALRSTLPFAIGQVQDAGLIFLGKMATIVAAELSDEPLEDVVATTLAGLCGGTALLGLVLVGIGRARLTWLVSYLPMPVLGGYLAFIGFFCVEAGVALCIGDVVNGPGTWGRVVDPPFRVVLCAPGIVGGVFLSWVAARDPRGTRLPAAMVLLPAVFYVVLAILPNYDIEDARADGWLFTDPQGESARTSVLDVARLYDVERVHVRALAKLAPVWAAMVVVVAFSSCLDVAAIEIDLGSPLDMDRELTTVGVSNAVAGCAGGFTGSYIFSQTIFSCRAGCRSRLVGWTVVACELAVVACETDLLGALPLYFFAATLTFVGVDLLNEWLLESRHKFAQKSEYAALLFTFVAIQALGLNAGLVAGCVAASVHFMSSAVAAAAPKRVNKSSLSLRDPQESRKLSAMKHRLVVLELAGTVWWGTASSLLAKIKRSLGAVVDDGASPPGERSSLLREAARGPAAAPPDPEAARSWNVILDCRRVDGLDASACRACFVPLARLAAARGFGVAVSGLREDHVKLLAAHDALAGRHIRVFRSLDEALRWAEQRQLVAPTPDLSLLRNGGREHSPRPKKPRTRPLQLSPRRPEDGDKQSPDRDVSRHYTSAFSPNTSFDAGLGRHEASRSLDDAAAGPPRRPARGTPRSLGRRAAAFLATKILRVDQDDANFPATVDALRGLGEATFAPRAEIFVAGDFPDDFYCVVDGRVANNACETELESGEQLDGRREAAEVFGPGAFVGYVDWALQRPRRFSSHAVDKKCTVAVFGRRALDAIRASAPQVHIDLQAALLRTAATELANST